MRVHGLLALLSMTGGAVGQCISYPQFKSAGTLPIGLSPPGTGEEVSGVAASRCNPGILWVHDDKGNGPYLLAIRTDGKLAQQYLVSGFGNRDWEDIAVGPGPVLGKSYLYVGDIGNNDKTFPTQAILRIEEPDVPATPGPVVALPAKLFVFKYPSGARDAEALAVDPLDGTPYVLTKESGLTGYVFRYPLPLDSTTTKTLVLETTFFSPQPSFSAADFGPDGRRFYFRNANNVFWVERAWGKTVKDAFAGQTCSIIATNQGNVEGLAVTPDGLGLYCVSEGKGSTIWTTTGTLAGRTIPTFFCYGSGTAGNLGVPGVGFAGAPVLGHAPITWRVFDGPPRAGGLLVVSFTALPDGVFSFAGGWVHVLPDLPFQIALDGAGTFALPIGVLPDDPVLRGRRVHAQGFLVDASAATGITLSRGLTVRLDR